MMAAFLVIGRAHHELTGWNQNQRHLLRAVVVEVQRQVFVRVLGHHLSPSSRPAKCLFGLQALSRPIYSVSMRNPG